MSHRASPGPTAHPMLPEGNTKSCGPVPSGGTVVVLTDVLVAEADGEEDDDLATVSLWSSVQLVSTVVIPTASMSAIHRRGIGPKLFEGSPGVAAQRADIVTGRCST